MNDNTGFLSGLYRKYREYLKLLGSSERVEAVYHGEPTYCLMTLRNILPSCDPEEYNLEYVRRRHILLNIPEKRFET